MPPTLAAFLCTFVIVWAWRRATREGQVITGALWIPFVWLIILGSRRPSFWFGTTGSSDFEGNAFDRNLYLVLTCFALVVLSRRQVQWGAIIRDNALVFLFYGYLLFTCIWSDHPFVTFKRWFKDLTAIPVLLLFVSSLDPKQAIQSVFIKCAAILFFLSILFIKYYPELGRVYSNSGGVQVTGITPQKNTLGEVVVVFGLVILWGWLSAREYRKNPASFRNSYLPLMLLASGAWLLWVSDSKTSMICLLAGVAIIFSHKFPIIKRPRYFVTVSSLAILLFYILNEAFSLTTMLLELAGRDTTFTGRTAIWAAIKEHPVNPIFGCGYLMYWDDLGKLLIDGNEVELKTAHNGYIDLYLDGGIAGIFFFALMLVSTGAKVVRDFLTGSDHGRLRLAMLVVIILSNFSESSWVRRGPLWFAFLLFCLDYRRAFPAQEPALDSEEEEELAPVHYY